MYRVAASAWVYVAGVAGDDKVKVGITNHLQFRLGGLKSATGGERPHAFYTSWVEFFALEVERTAHRFLRRHALGKEWFACSPSVAACAVDRARRYLVVRSGEFSRSECDTFSQLKLDRLRKLADCRGELKRAAAAIKYHKARHTSIANEIAACKRNLDNPLPKRRRSWGGMR